MYGDFCFLSVVHSYANKEVGIYDMTCEGQRKKQSRVLQGMGGFSSVVVKVPF